MAQTWDLSWPLQFFDLTIQILTPQLLVMLQVLCAWSQGVTSFIVD